jgi:hypothetical protein
VPSSEYPIPQFARHDPAICLAPGIFRSLPRGKAYRDHRAEVTYEREGSTVRFVLPFLLGAEDLRLLQVLVSMAGYARTTLPREPETDTGQALKGGLAAQRDEDALVVRTRLARVLGALDREDCRDARTAVRRSLIRLASVVVIVTRGSKEASAHLLSHAVDSETGELVVALDPRVTAAALGAEQYARIDLAEVRALKGDLAVILHQRLCAWIDPGRTRLVRPETLVRYAFPEPARTASARAKRARRVRAAIACLADVGWTVDELRGVYTVGRPWNQDQTPWNRDQTSWNRDRRARDSAVSSIA